jgi:iron-sulfur cluster repair protein YtfE (RIC family)
MNITGNTMIEDLVEQLPESVSFLREKGIVCIVCGEPVWGTLAEVARQKGLSGEAIEAAVEELNQLKNQSNF